MRLHIDPTAVVEYRSVGRSSRSARMVGGRVDRRAVQRVIGRVSLATMLWVMLAAGPGSAPAGAVTFMTIESNPTAFEGEPGDTGALVFTLRLTDPIDAPVSGRFFTSARAPAQSSATSGTACTAGVDFVRAEIPFTIPAFVTTIAISVTLCPDNTVEQDELLDGIVADVVNAECLEGTCIETGRIVDDDGAPRVSVNNVTTREPSSGSTSATFTVELSHPHPGFTVVADLRTRDGTARTPSSGPVACGVITDRILPDYLSRTTRFTFASGVRTATFSVPVCADQLDEPSEGYSVEVIPVTNAVAGLSGQGTILDRLQPMFTGTFSVSPDDASVAPHDPVELTLEWTVSDGVWRDLSVVDLRIARRPHGNTTLLVRWDESSNTFSLCSARGMGALRCGPAGVPGSAEILDGPNAHLHLAGSSATGSGPTGPSVELRLMMSFDDGALGIHDVEVAAADDTGASDSFVGAGTLRVERTT